MDKTDVFHEPVDLRPQKKAWAPGLYMNICADCGKQFIGDKRAIQCAPCAYGDSQISVIRDAIIALGKIDDASCSAGVWDTLQNVVTNLEQLLEKRKKDEVTAKTWNNSP